MDRLFEVGDEGQVPLDGVVPDDGSRQHRLATSASGRDGNHERESADALLVRARGLLDPVEVELSVDADAMWARGMEMRAARAAAYELERAASEVLAESLLAEAQRQRIDRARAAAARRVEVAARKAAGGCYVGQRRSPNRPTHVEVDEDAWSAVKRDALRRGVALATIVGALVADVPAVSLAASAAMPIVTGGGRRARRFARLFITDDAWRDFRVRCEGAGVTVARGVGVAVELEAARIRAPRERNLKSQP